MNKKKKKLAVKPLLGVLFIVAVMLGVGSVSIMYTYRTLINEAKSYIGEISELSAVNMSKNIAANRYVQEYFVDILSKTDLSDDEKIIEVLGREIALAYDNIMSIGYVDLKGKGYSVRENLNVSRIDVADTEYFKRAVKGEELVTRTMIDSATRQTVNNYVRPVFQNNVIVGVHISMCMAASLENVLYGDNMDNSWCYYIIDKEGNRVIDEGFYEAAPYKPFREFKANDTTVRPLLRAMAVNETRGAVIGNNENNISYYLAYEKLSINDWYLMIAVPYSYIIKNARSVLGISFLVMFAAVIAAVAFAKYLMYVKSSGQKELYRHVYYDDLTGLLSKKGFILKAGELLDSTRERYAVVFIDVDNFRTINDLFGYDVGTDILKGISELIKSHLQKNELAARLTGDEFVALVKYGTDSEIIEKTQTFIRDLNDTDLTEDNNSYNVICYLGIYKLEGMPHSGEMESYIDRAKISTLELKNSRRTAYAFYSESLQKQMHFDAELEKDFNDALKSGDFKVYIQPKYDANSRTLAGGEALIRWQHKTKGFLTPDKFVALFERNGNITDVDLYVYEEVCKLQRKLLDNGYEPVPISVNQSRLHLYHSDYIATLKSILHKYDLPAKYVELEITENIALSTGEVLEKAVKSMHQIGFKVSMDDFGSGESSLNILKDIDIDVLKLDRKFFLETENNAKARQIIKSVIDMAGHLDISTVAEGVENEEQLQFLQEAGCDLIQGFLFGRPIPYEEFEKLFLKEVGKKQIS